MSGRVDVVGIGIPVVDCLALLERLPASDEQTVMEDLSWQGGGKVPTALVALSRLGARVGIIGVVGDDMFGRFCANDFEWNGVDTSHLIVDRDQTTHFTIVLAELKKKARSFIGKAGSCRAVQPSDLDAGYIGSARFLHLANMDQAAIEAARLARQQGVRVVFDADLFEKETVDNLKLIDVFIFSRFFYDALFSRGNFKENCREIQDLGPEIVVVTLGAKGCAGIDRSAYFEVPAFSELPVTDTTGAGDVFHGAFIYGMLMNWSSAETARFASAVSSIKCTRLGGRAGIPDYSVVRQFLDGHTLDYTEIDRRVERYKGGLFGASDAGLGVREELRSRDSDRR